MTRLPRGGLAFLTLLLVLLCALAVQFYQSQLQQAEAREQDQLLSIARLKVEQIAAWRQERLGDGRVLNANRRLLASLVDWLHGAADPAVRNDLTAVLEALQRN